MTQNTEGSSNGCAWLMGSTLKNMPDKEVVPMIGSNQLIDVDALRGALKKMPDKDLAQWYVEHFKTLGNAVKLIRDEVTGRMIKNGSKTFHALDGRKIKMSQKIRRTCVREAMDALQMRIEKEFGVALTLYRVKEEILPNMDQVKEARELSMDIAIAIGETLTEKPDAPSLEIKGVSKKMAEAFEVKE